MRGRKKKSNIWSKISNRLSLSLILAAVVLLFMLIRFRSFTVFLVVAILAGVLNYFIHIMDIHIHIGHVYFLSIIFSYELGFIYGVVMIIMAHVIPEILAGHADTEMLVSGVLYTVMSFIASIFNSVNIVTLGLTLTVLLGVFGFIMERATGTSLVEIITETGTEVVMNIVYFVGFARLLLAIV